MTLRNLAIAWLFIGAGACAGTLEDRAQFITEHGDAGASDAGAIPAAACPDVVQTVFPARCATAGCHAAVNPQSKLDLASPDLAARVVNVAGASGGLLVDPEHPEQSLLYKTLLPGGPGARMPLGSALDDATIACVLLWAESLGSEGAPVDAAIPDGPAADAGTVTRIAAGATASYTDKAGQVWSADFGFTGGATAIGDPPVTIGNTGDSPLYNAERYGTFAYGLPVANGSYTVTLKFAEVFTQITAAGQRQFDVSINGQQVLTNFDIFAAAGGRDTAVDRSFPVEVSNGRIDLDFQPGAIQSPKVDAISVVPR